MVLVRLLTKPWFLGAIVVAMFLALLPKLLGSAPALGSWSNSQVETQKLVTNQVAVDQFCVISPRFPNLKFSLYTKKFGPEGEPPQPKNGDTRILRAYLAKEILDKFSAQYAELRDETIAGVEQVVAKVTWELKDVRLLFPNYRGPVSGSWAGNTRAWFVNLEVAAEYESNGYGQWIWRFAERQFARPGDVVIVVDASRTASGLTGWTSAQFPGLWQFIQNAVGPAQYILTDPIYHIWIYQYSDDVKQFLTGGQ